MLEIKTNQVFLIDLDGTIADSSIEFSRWRGVCSGISCGHYLGTEHRWCALGSKTACIYEFRIRERGIFGKETVSCLFPIQGAREALKKISKAFYVSGREESLRGATLDWLEKYEFPMFSLYMKADHDIRPIPEVKLDIYRVICAVHGNPGETWVVLDDDARVQEAIVGTGLQFMQAPMCFE